MPSTPTAGAHLTEVVQVRGRYPWQVRCACKWRSNKTRHLGDAEKVATYHAETGDVANGEVA